MRIIPETGVNKKGLHQVHFFLLGKTRKVMGHIKQVAHSASCINAIDKQVISDVTQDRYKKDL